MSGRILVVDDQRAIAEMMTGVLQGRGYEVLTAFDGETALRQVHAERPDLVVSDILMPGMDGYELCRRVRSDPLTALLPIVLVTSLDPQAERINGLEAGADDFLSKPVNWEELFARVKSLLRVKRLQDEVVSWNMELEGRVRDQVSQLERLSWAKLGHDVGLGIGIAQGEATLGVIGFEQRWEYAAIGNVPNLAARLCGEAGAGEIILDAQTEREVADIAETDPVGPLALRGFQQPIAAFKLKALR